MPIALPQNTQICVHHHTSTLYRAYACCGNRRDQLHVSGGQPSTYYNEQTENQQGHTYLLPQSKLHMISTTKLHLGQGNNEHKFSTTHLHRSYLPSLKLLPLQPVVTTCILLCVCLQGLLCSKFVTGVMEV